MSETLFGNAGTAPNNDERLVDAYVEIGRTLDDLPYTQDFEALLERIGVGVEAAGRREVFHRLHNLRKASKLPKLGRGETAPTLVEPEEERLLVQLVTASVGTLGQRDQLLYDAKFDEIVGTFNEKTGRSMTPHTVWRLVAKLAK
ncbi:MAG: hypothetical protein WC718_11875 [Phycisphaerales bacterium]|jgi:hypothetical protein